MVIKKHDLGFTPTEEDFWGLVKERQSIWHKRFKLKQPSPWTADPILQRYKFTNCYRELDRGTKWAVKHIIKRSLKRPKTLLLQTVAYRCLNRIETFQKVSLPGLSKDSLVDFFTELDQMKGYGQTLFTSAYTTPVIEGRNRFFAYGNTVIETREKLRELCREMRRAPSLKQAWKAIQCVQGIGGFKAYEIVNDLMYSRKFFKNKFTEDDFIHIGPGAIKGLQYLYPGCTRSEAMYRLKDLRERQRECLPEDFPYYKDRDISLANLEGCFCEWRKYLTLKAGKTSGRLFTPVTGVKLAS